jgi:hypothetical protein
VPDDRLDYLSEDLEFFFYIYWGSSKSFLLLLILLDIEVGEYFLLIANF